MVLTFFSAIREAVKRRIISGRLIEAKTEVHDTARGEHGKFLSDRLPGLPLWIGSKRNNYLIVLLRAIPSCFSGN